MSDAWWGRHALAEEHCLYWRIGGLALWFQRTGEVLHVWREWGEIVPAAQLNVDAPPPPASANPLAVYCFAGVPEAVEIAVLQPDRTVVSRPVAPLYVPAGDAVTLYLETPVWLGVRLAGAAQLLFETPTVRLSDTWLGTSTRSGELAYASRLVAGTDPAAPRASHVLRAVVRYRNRTSAQLAVERIALPAPALGVYAGRDGRLWSEALQVEQRGEDELAQVSVGSGPPPEAGPVLQLSAARTRPAPTFSLRAVAALLRSEG